MDLWKYALVVPALFAFMLFQVNVVAQEKVNGEIYNYQHYFR
jgi:hypothetical protein